MNDNNPLFDKTVSEIENNESEYEQDNDDADNDGLQDLCLDHPVDIDDIKVEEIQNLTISEDTDSIAKKLEDATESESSDTAEDTAANDEENNHEFIRTLMAMHATTSKSNGNYLNTLLTRPFNMCEHQFGNQLPLGRQQYGSTRKSVKYYTCDVCAKTFGQKYILNQHKRTHTGQKSYDCGTCSLTFYHKSTLNKHMRSHQDKKRYTCDDCSKKFRHKRHLRRHIRQIHLGETPQTCDTGAKKCEDKDSSKGHKRTCLDEK